MSVVLLSTLVWQVIDFLREVANYRTNRAAVITQATAWIGGVLLVWLCAHTAAVQTFVIPTLNVTVGNLDFGGTVLAGMVVASLGSSLVDVKQAIDSSDSAAKPPLVSPVPPAQPVPAAAAPTPQATG